MTTIDRRTFVLSTAGALASGLPVLGANDRVNVAVIGVRGRGREHMEQFAKNPGSCVAALCDVDTREHERALEALLKWQAPRPKLYQDLRKLLEDKDVDAVSIATCNHWHALATVWACQAGKHVYVEKPASHDVWEGRKMVEAARKYDRVVQLGTQSRSAPHYRDMVAYLRAGKLGRVHMAKAWNSQLRGPIGKKADGPVPPGVDYGLWLGPAPERPFNVNRFHSTWHWNWAY